jgi:hypothetical protein
MKKAYYDVASIAFARIIVVFLQLYYAKIFTNHLSDYELGMYYFLNTISYFLNALLFIPIDSYQQSKLYELVKRNIALSTYIRMNKKIILPFLYITFFLVGSVFLVERIYAVNLLVCVVMALFLYVTTFAKNLLNNLGHRRIVSFLQILESLAKIILLLIFFTFLDNSGLNLLSSNGLALIMIFGIALLVLSKLDIFSTKDKIFEEISLKKLFEFCYPMSIAAVLNWVQLQGYRLVLVPLGFADMIGIFSAVSGLGMAGMSAVSMIYSQYLLPRVYQSAGRFAKTYVLLAIVVVFVVACGTLLSAKLLIPLLTKPEFGVYANLMVYGVLIEAGNFIIGGISVKLAIESKTKTILAGAVCSALFVICGFSVAYVINSITFHTIGLILVSSQIIMAVYMYYQAY